MNTQCGLPMLPQKSVHEHTVGTHGSNQGRSWTRALIPGASLLLCQIPEVEYSLLKHHSSHYSTQAKHQGFCLPLAFKIQSPGGYALTPPLRCPQPTTRTMCAFVLAVKASVVSLEFMPHANSLWHYFIFSHWAERDIFTKFLLYEVLFFRKVP